MQLNHNFKTKCHNLSDLFNIKINTLSKFMTKLEEQSLIDPIRYDSNKYLGDGFEFFIEILLRLHPIDNRIGIYRYEPNQLNDNGVDGIGLNLKGDKSVIQIKYRSNKQELLTTNKDNLSNLITDGMIGHNVILDTSNKFQFRHFIFTTATGLHYYTDSDMFKGKVKCFGYNEIKQFVDNNYGFWNECRNLIK